MDHQNYRLIKNRSQYDGDVGYEVNEMTKKTAVQMKDRTFSSKDRASIIAFMQDVKSAFDACNIHEIAVMWFCKHYLISPA